MDKELHIIASKWIAIITVYGEVAIEYHYRLKNFIIDNKDRYKAFIIDVSDITILTSADCGALYDICKITNESLFIVIPKENTLIHMLIENMKIGKSIPLFETQKDALDYIDTVYS